MSAGSQGFASSDFPASHAMHARVNVNAHQGTAAESWFPMDTHVLPLPLATVAALRDVERRATIDASPHTLMTRAGAAAADFLLRHIPSALHETAEEYRAIDTTSESSARAGGAACGNVTRPSRSIDHPKTAASPAVRIWFFAGPGNNGGDALVAATRLHTLGIPVCVTLPVPPTQGDALWAYEAARRQAVPIQQDGPVDAQRRDLRQDGWCVDGLFGIGLRRPVAAPFAAHVALMNTLSKGGAHVLALDLPSGLDAMTGQKVSDATDPGCIVHATHTMSFIGATPGLFTGQGRDHSGTVLLAPLALSDFTVPAAVDPDVLQDDDSHGKAQGNTVCAQDLTPLRLNAPPLFMPHFATRRPSSHKGTFGSVAIIGGDTGTCGAAILSARAALYAGAGRVHTALIGDGAPPYDPPHPEIMLRRIDAIALDTMDALSIGPGLGTSDRAADIIERVLRETVGAHCHALLDADALNLIARRPVLAQAVAAAGAWVVMTPHPGEAARLLDVGTQDIERDRLAAARALVSRYHCTVVLKGAGTLIASYRAHAQSAPGDASAHTDASAANPPVDIVLNTTGNTGLASGGSGDVLSGVIGALLAQHLPPREAALAGVYLHGLAAEALTAQGEGPAGLTAGELAPMIRKLLNQHLRLSGHIAG